MTASDPTRPVREPSDLASIPTPIADPPVGHSQTTSEGVTPSCETSVTAASPSEVTPICHRCNRAPFDDVEVLPCEACEMPVCTECCWQAGEYAGSIGADGQHVCDDCPAAEWGWAS